MLQRSPEDGHETGIDALPIFPVQSASSKLRVSAKAR
jgi:hypothetical protein